MEWHIIVSTKKQAITLFIKAPNHNVHWLVDKPMTNFSIDSTTLPSIKTTLKTSLTRPWWHQHHYPTYPRQPHPLGYCSIVIDDCWLPQQQEIIIFVSWSLHQVWNVPTLDERRGSCTIPPLMVPTMLPSFPYHTKGGVLRRTCGVKLTPSPFCSPHTDR